MEAINERHVCSLNSIVYMHVILIDTVYVTLTNVRCQVKKQSSQNLLGDCPHCLRINLGTVPTLLAIISMYEGSIYVKMNITCGTDEEFISGQNAIKNAITQVE